ncbi:MAG: type II toxin-antitoxin system RelE/ParE family toxin [Rhodocyclaceae bacterium]|nr:type II toxin-antitoxin system RelE/ParE family toxin [Rhodocyclaceae bacterium]
MIRLRPRARRDLDEAVAWYLSQSAFDAADGFVAAAEEAFRHLALHPGTGSPRFGQLLELPGLRTWQLADYPYLVFYFERPDRLDVARVLHSCRDISPLLLKS